MENEPGGKPDRRCECGRRYCRGQDPKQSTVLHRIPVTCSAILGEPGEQDQAFRDPDGHVFTASGSTEVEGLRVGDTGWMIFVAGDKRGLWIFKREGP
jgi:hypothetical protein